MKIAFMGAGKVGCTLGLYLKKKHEIVGYISRTSSSAEEAAKLCDTKAYKDAAELLEKCDLLYITTPDDAIADVWTKLCRNPKTAQLLKGKLVSHASGSLSSDILSNAKDYGAYAYSTHPLFAIASKIDSAKKLNKALFVVEGDEEKLALMTNLYAEMGNPVQTISTEEKTRYHAAAVLASNHVVALYSLAAKELEKCGFSTKAAAGALAPLFLGNAQNIASLGPIKSLTGPAERGDYETINKHLQLLSGNTKQIYELLNEEALAIAKEKHKE